MKRHFVVKASKGIKASVERNFRGVWVDMLKDEYAKAAIESGSISSRRELVEMGDPIYTNDDRCLDDLADYIVSEFPDAVSCNISITDDSEIEVSLFSADNTVLGRISAWYSNGRFGFDLV